MKMKIKETKNIFLKLLCIKSKSKAQAFNNAASSQQEKQGMPMSLQSISSSSTVDSRPETPIRTSDTRGIFRTLEPEWYFHSALLPPTHHQTQDWLRFDDQSQYLLETSLLNSKHECALYKTSFGPCSVLLKPLPMQKSTRHSMAGPPPKKNASMPTLRPSRVTTNGLRPLELNNDVRRVISPVWWFEQDSVDGSKGMCRFDEKNQIRLEALSDGRNKFVLSDDAFQGSFTVVLEADAHQELKEEVRGFLYFESNTAIVSKKNRFLMEGFVDDEEEHWIHLARRYSI